MAFFDQYFAPGGRYNRGRAPVQTGGTLQTKRRLPATPVMGKLQIGALSPDYTPMMALSAGQTYRNAHAGTAANTPASVPGTPQLAGVGAMRAPGMVSPGLAGGGVRGDTVTAATNRRGALGAIRSQADQAVLSPAAQADVRARRAEAELAAEPTAAGIDQGMMMQGINPQTGYPFGQAVGGGAPRVTPRVTAAAVFGQPAPRKAAPAPVISPEREAFLQREADRILAEKAAAMRDYKPVPTVERLARTGRGWGTPRKGGGLFPLEIAPGIVEIPRTKYHEEMLAAERARRLKVRQQRQQRQQPTGGLTADQIRERATGRAGRVRTSGLPAQRRDARGAIRRLRARAAAAPAHSARQLGFKRAIAIVTQFDTRKPVVIDRERAKKDAAYAKQLKALWEELLAAFGSDDAVDEFLNEWADVTRA
jgi:hypothetical protein